MPIVERHDVDLAIHRRSFKSTKSRGTSRVVKLDLSVDDREFPYFRLVGTLQLFGP